MSEYKDSNREGRPVRRKKMGPKKRRRILEKKLSAISLLILGFTFVFITLFNIIAPRSTVSMIEKRTLNTFPEFSWKSYFSGEYTEGIANWYDDTAPFRDFFKNCGSTINSLAGIATSDTAIFVATDGNLENGANAGADDTADAVEDTEAATEAVEQTNNGVSASALEEDQKDFTAEEAEGSQSNGILIVKQSGHWRAMELFGNDTPDRLVAALNSLEEQVGDSVNVYVMPIPISCEFYLPSNYQQYTQDQDAYFENFKERLDDGITYVDVIPVMKKHTEENIYLRTDHHWTPLGAYYGARTLAEAAGVDFRDLSEYETKTNEGFVGTMYSYSQDSRIKDDPEDFVYYVPSDITCDYYNTSFSYTRSGSLFADVSGSASYSVFMGGDELVCKMKTSVNNGRKLLIIKDSFGNATVPCYSGSFEEVYVVDMRYCNFNIVNLIEEQGITDVTFTMCAFSMAGDATKNLDAMVNGNTSVSVVDTAPQ